MPIKGLLASEHGCELRSHGVGMDAERGAKASAHGCDLGPNAHGVSLYFECSRAWM